MASISALTYNVISNLSWVTGELPHNFLR